jgi:ABC-2 type transport system permease protein
VNLVLLGHTWRSQRLKLAIVAIGLAAWGFLMPVIYSQFGVQFKQLFESGVIPKQFAQFGQGDVFTLPGVIALGFIHPISIILNSVFAVGFAAGSIAGERQRGTLEVLLARPLSRRQVHATLLVAVLLFIAISMTAILVGNLAGATVFGVIDELDLARVPLVWLDGLLLFGALASIGLAASASFDRLSPALGITIGFTIVSYFLEVLGSLWPDASVLQPYSLFHYLRPNDLLSGTFDPFGPALMLAVAIAGIAWAAFIFPRRDLAAPS